MKKPFSFLISLLVLVLILGIPALASTIAFGSRTLSLGMSGSDVSQLQTDLKTLRYYKQKITGSFDKKTKSAVVQFQTANKLPADGIVNQDDYDKLAQLLSPEPAPDPAPAPEPAPDPDPAPAPAPKHHVLGYYTVDYTGDVASYNSLATYGSQINSIATFTFLVDGSGNVIDSTPQNAVDLALSKGITPLALIHNYRNGGFNATDAHNLLVSSTNRQRLIQNMVNILKSKGFKGVNIDIENVPYADRMYYTALVQEFKAALQPLGFLTTFPYRPKPRIHPQTAGRALRLQGPRNICRFNSANDLR